MGGCDVRHKPEAAKRADPALKCARSWLGANSANMNDVNQNRFGAHTHSFS